jgi:hypothetical protein
LDGSDLPPTDQLVNLRRFLKEAVSETYPLPLPRSVVRQEGLAPRRVPSARGDGWIGIENATREELENADLPEPRSNTVATFRRREAA